MKRAVKFMIAVFAFVGVFAFTVSAKTVDIDVPKFGIMINGEEVDNGYAQYPCIVYNDITYFPMTFYDSRALGLTTEYSLENGLAVINIGTEPCKPDFARGNRENTSDTAIIAEGKIAVNGKSIDNSSEQYPLLLYRDITYFPLTWRFAVEEFGWSYRFTSRLGLEISVDASDMKSPVPDDPEPVACGDGLTWDLDESTGTLRIEGSGDMWDFLNADHPWGTDIKNVITDDGVTNIGERAFWACGSLTDAVISDSVVSIGDSAFKGCVSLSHIVIPDSVTVIEDQAFEGCRSLTQTVIPEGVETIGDHTFGFCTALERIDIPESVTAIGDHAFEGCSSLEQIRFGGTKDQWDALGLDADDINNATVTFGK